MNPGVYLCTESACAVIIYNSLPAGCFSFGLRHFRYMTVSVQRGGHFWYMTTSVHMRSISVHVFLLYDFGTCEVPFRYIIMSISVHCKRTSIFYADGRKNAQWMLVCFMVALWNRETIYIFMLWFVLLLSSSFFFSSPNLSRRRLDVCHTSTHIVALVRI